MFILEYSAKAITDLKKLPKTVQLRILDKMDTYAAQSDPGIFAKELSGRSESRFRVGDYRAIVDLDKKTETILVLRVGKRDTIYGIKI